MIPDGQPEGQRGDSLCIEASRASYFLSVVLTMACTLVLGFTKEFVVWDQILVVVHEDPLEMLNNMQAHALRFSLMYPVLLVSEIFSLSLDYVFSATVLGMLVLLGFLISQIASLIIWDKVDTWVSYYPATFVLLSLVSIGMNGRIMFAFLGASVILHQQIQLIRGKSARPLLKWSIQAFGLYLMSVSSGAFIVGVFMIGLYVSFFVWKTRRENFRGVLTAAVASCGLGFVVAPWIAVYVTKNLEFYDGSVISMLSHGPGKILLANNELFALIIPSIPLTCILIFHSIRLMFRLYSRNSALAPLIMGMGVSAAIGLFGYSTFLSVVLPGIVIFMAILCPFGLQISSKNDSRSNSHILNHV